MKLVEKAGGFEAQFRVGPAGRPRVVIMLPERMGADARLAAAQERATRIQGAVSLLVRAKLAKAALVNLQLLAAARTQREFADVEAAARTMAAQAPELAPAQHAVTFRDVAERWLSGELHALDPERAEFKDADSVNNTRGLMNVILPLIGNLPIAAITADDCDRVKKHVNAIRKKNGQLLKLGQRKKYCRAVRKVLGFGVEPLRLIKTVPVSEDWVPKGVETKRAFQMIYPSEDAKLMRCGDVKLWTRFYLALLWRCGLRPSEAARLRWRNHSTIDGIGKLNVEKTKAKRGVKARKGRSFHLDDDVQAVFVAFKPADAQPDDYVFPAMAKRGALKRVVLDVLHPALRAAGLDVDRPALFQNDDECRHIVCHDGRATHITMKGALGYSEGDIMRVTGHETSKEIKTYTREIGELAELVARGKLEWFEPLDQLLGLRPEGSTGAGGVARTVARVINFPVKTGGSRSPARTSEAPFLQSEHAKTPVNSPSDCRNPAAVPPENGGVAQALAGLTAAIAAAAAAGKWSLVERLTAQLEGLSQRAASA